MNILLRRKELIETINHDDGKAFISGESQRLDVIRKQLAESLYQETSLPLVSLYSKEKPENLDGRVIVLSSHIDTVRQITRPFWDEDTCRGTLDNAITNHILVEMMLADELPEQVIVAFTGDEESGNRGARMTAKYLEEKCPAAKPCFITLDITDNCGVDDYAVSMEYRKDRKKLAKKIYKKIENASYFDKIGKIRLGMTRDETDEYRKFGKAVSVCLPVDSEYYHSNHGVGIKRESMEIYRRFLVDTTHLLLKKEELVGALKRLSD
ncbi:MAG: M28 family peptidase [Lachnospiraceae bacterium]|nr:M28 family peptidase [Lachnospiraceae bacterium]